MILLIVMLATAVALVLVGCKTSRAGYASAPYQVVRVDGRFEVRDYPSLLVVETPMARGGNGADGSFMRLFRYIAGGNDAGRKIAMTTPVFMAEQETNRTMAFVLPPESRPGRVPQPTDSSVLVRELAAGRFAVLRFRGGRNAANEQAMAARLKTWLELQGLKSVASPVYGYFDPPWTPSFLRRNEVMLRLEMRP